MVWWQQSLEQTLLFFVKKSQLKTLWMATISFHRALTSVHILRDTYVKELTGGSPGDQNSHVQELFHMPAIVHDSVISCILHMVISNSEHVDFSQTCCVIKCSSCKLWK